MIQRNSDESMAMNLAEIVIVTSESYQPNMINVMKWKHVSDLELNQEQIR